MPLKVPQYRVLIAAEDHPDDVEHATEYELHILNGDRLRTELEGPRNGIFDAQDAPQHTVTLWIWAALMRTHRIDQPFQAFKDRLLHWEDMDKDKPEDAPADPGSPADPTRPGAGTPSPSSSPTTSATSADGSTPTPTND